MRRWPLVILLVAAVLSPAIAGTIRHDVSDSQYTDLAAQPEYASVGRLGGASGVLIAPGWVLTAAHVVNGGSLPSTFTIGGISYPVIDGTFHPLFSASNLTAGYDLGLVRLGTPVSGITPASLYAGTSELGRVAVSVGYGNTGTGLTGYVSGTSGTKRAGRNVLDLTGQMANTSWSSSILLADFDNIDNPADSVMGLNTPRDLEYCIAPGDSGGGTFITIANRTWLVGIHSFYNSVDGLTDADYGDYFGVTRVSSFVSWIDQQMTARYWSSTSGGLFSSGSNWLDSSPAGVGEMAVFYQNATYAVDFAADAGIVRLLVRDGNVTFNLNGHTLDMSGISDEAAVIIGKANGDSVSATLTGGGLLTSPDGAIAAYAGTTATMTMTGSGTTWNIAGSLGIGGRADVAGGIGSLIVGQGAILQIGDTARLWPGGSLRVDGSASIASLVMSGGTLAGSGAITVSGLFSWSGGSVATASPLLLEGSGTFSGSGKTLNGVIENRGQITWSDGSISGNAYAAIHNIVDAVFNISGSRQLIVTSGLPLFDNDGSLYSQGTSVNLLWQVDNSGNVVVLSGNLQLGAGGNSTGLFQTSTGSTLTFSGGTHYLDNVSFLNSGTVLFTGGQAVFSGTVVIPGLVRNVTGSIIVEDGTLTLSGSTPEFSGSTLTAGNWRVNDGGTLIVSNAANVTVNSANVTLAGATSSFPRLDSLADNRGQFAVLGGRSFTTVGDFANSGSLTIGDGSVFNVSGGFYQSAGSTSVAGLFQFSGTATISGGVMDVTGSMDGADMVVDGTAQVYLNTLAGLTSLTIGPGGSVTMTGESGLDGLLTTDGLTETTILSDSLTGSLIATSGEFTFSEPVATPEPATLWLLAGCGLGLLARRRHLAARRPPTRFLAKD